MATKLLQITQIKSGVFARPEREGDIAYLQAKDFDEFGNISSTLRANLKADRTNDKHMLKSGDVLFAAKGSKNFATVYRSDFPAVASTTFLVLRVRGSQMLPEYLVWVLNNPATKIFLKQHAIGSSIASISKAVLEELEIMIPSMEQQQQILAVSRLSKAEHDLRLKIAELRQLQIQEALNRAIK